MKELTFVQEKNQGVEGFGIISGPNYTKKNGFDEYAVYMANMDEDFGTWVVAENELVSLTPDEVEAKLAVIKERADEFKHFIIQFNDLKMDGYYIEETDSIKEERLVNEVLIS